MLSTVKAFKGYNLHSLDGEIGSVKGFYFDDANWAIRYLIAETGNWLAGRQVLISPHALTAVNHEGKYIVVNLTNKQIEDSPSLENDVPVSRQFEDAYYGYYGYPPYSGSTSLRGAFPNLVRVHTKQVNAAQSETAIDPKLRSTHKVIGYNIQATDGEIGHVDDFIIDDRAWVIRYLVVSTRNLWPGKKILISPRWIERVSWNESKVFVKLLRETIRQSPEYTGSSLLTRDYEAALHQHYDCPGYWDDEAACRVDPK